jgi:hypothetical protein
MHGSQRPYRPGRGFTGTAEPYAGTAEPDAGPEEEPNPAEAWAGVHAGLTKDFQQRLAEHNKQAAKFQRTQEQQSRWSEAQAKQRMATGRFGMKAFYEKRPGELLGTPAYNANWLTDRRPAVERYEGPMGGNRIANLVERRTGQKVLSSQAEELTAEGEVLGMLKEYVPPPKLGEVVTPQAGMTDPTAVLRRPAGPTAPAASPFPRPPSAGAANPYPWGGSLPRGSQFEGMVFGTE